MAWLPEPGIAPYPAWKAFDQTTGRFLYTSEGITGSASPDDLTTVRVLAAGHDTPVATIHCDAQCSLTPSFGPGADEFTVLSAEADVEQADLPPHRAQVYGFDGSTRRSIDLSGALSGPSAGTASHGITDLEWSPDGRLLAISTHTGGWDALCGSVCEARVWILRTGGVATRCWSTDGPTTTSRTRHC